MLDPWTSDGEELSAWAAVLLGLVFVAVVSAGVFVSWWVWG